MTLEELVKSEWYLKRKLTEKKFRTRKSTSVNCTIEANALPKEFKTVKVTETPNKVAIKKALESGEVIEGCELITNYNLTIK